MVEGDWTPHGGAAATRLLLERSPDLTAIFVHSDMMAIGVLSALWQTGRRVPADVAVVSCDDIPFAEYLTPPLTTVRVPLAETGRQAVELLLRSIAGEPVPERTPPLPVELIVRGSCGAPKPAIGLELRVSRFMLPSLVVCRGERGGGGMAEVGDGGDQGDELVLPVAGPVGDLVLHDPDVPGLARVQVLPGPGSVHDLLPRGALDLGVHQDGQVGAVDEELQRLQDQVRFHPPQQRRPGIRGGAPVRPVVEVPVGDQQPVLLQPRVELPRQGLLPAALGRARADRGQHRRVRRALADRHHPGLGKRRPPAVLPVPG